MNLRAVTKLGIRDHRVRVAHPSDDVRHRALARLYERRAAVDHLIHALERYQQEQMLLREDRAAVTVLEM
jgi:hypothetical protein